MPDRRDPKDRPSLFPRGLDEVLRRIQNEEKAEAGVTEPADGRDSDSP
jgi:hypothetical protein